MQHWTQNLPFAGLDLETTGVDPSRCRPVSAALVSHLPEAWELLPGFPMLIHPGRDALPIPDATVAIHGITTRQATQNGAPLPRALEFINQALLEVCALGRPLVVSNARFDLTILDRSSRRCGVVPLHERARAHGVPVHVLDPMLIDHWWDRYREGRRRVRDLCALYGVVSAQPHEAVSDAVTAADLAREVLSEALSDISGCSWRRERTRELQRCGSMEELHALQCEWHRHHHEDLQLRKSRVGPPGWPVLAFSR